ncbi:MAG: hypothetical protein GX265_05195 [Mollicutes bacterium]|nr:hypothetical protein [Mollicutes bacterium]
MTKSEVLDLFLDLIYKYNKKTVLSRNEIKKLEGHFKNNIGKFKNIEDFKNSNSEIAEILNRRDVKSVKDEIDKQLKNYNGKKGLQPGILSECNMVQTLAKILNFKSYKDLEQGGIAGIPKTLYEVVKSKENTICAARYVYYNEGEENNFLIQYGNPKMEDAAAILYSNEIAIEIKDMPALLMDTDLLYDEDGKIIITEELVNKFPNYIKYIKEFNNKTSIIEKLGSNYLLFSKDSSLEEKQELINDYFNITNIDIIITTLGRELVAIKTEDLNFIFSDGTPLIDISRSEIRTTGKNALKTIFTPKFFHQVLKEKEVILLDDVCRIYKDNNLVIGLKKGRGKNIETRFSINNNFFAKLTPDIKRQIEDKDLPYIDIPVRNIQQSKSGISLHITLKKSKSAIREELYPCKK